MSDIADGYFWCRNPLDGGTTFIALHDGGAWFVAGLWNSIRINPEDIIEPVQRPNREGLN